MMFRLRRYRLFLIFAVLITILLVRLSRTKDWDRYARLQSFNLPSSSPNEDFNGGLPPNLPIPDTAPESEPSNEQDQVIGSSKPIAELKSTVPDSQPAISLTSVEKPPNEQDQAMESSKPIAESKSAVPDSQPAISLPNLKPSPAQNKVVPKVVVPDRKDAALADPYAEPEEYEEYEDEIYPVPPPGRQEFPSFSAVPTTIHWEKQREHFPVPTESIIPLPTGPPVSIPEIQHKFNDETPDAKINREKRQAAVKEEFRKAWIGYKTNAWLHDELSPVTGSFRDPFCGWAATLVDSLDTLWIMGFHDEFEEAARAVDQIDFTTSQRSDIPLFETTIRYLGGLLAAYDVSEGKYRNLLDKAVELAEILIGAFDTPNRMPMLYYRWKPAFASQPHRASQRSNLAELGSLSIEFTRLAQLTGEPRYYDAVARITNALSEWQDRGTKLDGVFPSSVDASGCNHSVSTPLTPISKDADGKQIPYSHPDPPLGYVPPMPNTVREPKPKKKLGSQDGPGTLEVQILPGEPGKAQILGWGEDRQKRDEIKNAKRELVESALSASTPPPSNHNIDPRSTLNSTSSHGQDGQEVYGRAIVEDWDCQPQGLTSSSNYGWDKFSMGGGQDSAYEYFPKQYLLLGGLEEKYRKMYIKAADAIRKWMLYRPMLPDDRDVLFSGSVITHGNPEEDYKLTAEVTHLTCFIGGMIGMGAKIFDIEADLQIAEKLTDGCVWAYEATESGIMPEGATVQPCESAEHCPWNQTAYWEYLDPVAGRRDRILDEYIQNKAAREAQQQIAKQAAVVKAEAERISAEEEAQKDPSSAHDALAKDETSQEVSPDIKATPKAGGVMKREVSVEKEVPLPITHDFRQDTPQGSSPRDQVNNNGLKSDASSGLNKGASTPQERLYLQRVEDTEVELQGPKGFRPEAPAEAPEAQNPSSGEIPDPLQPPSHEEFVEARIKEEGLGTGYVTISKRKYILRPEAIESVWYMYRITGDTKWQDKGWAMFEAIIRATSTKYGHSAIYDVTTKEINQVDEMESFWLAETLKYFYLLYSTPDTISLDDWVLNTEAHPFKRPR